MPASYEDVKKLALEFLPRAMQSGTSLEQAQELVQSKLLEGLECASADEAEVASEEAKDQRLALEYGLHVVAERALDGALEKKQGFQQSGVTQLLDLGIWMANKGAIDLNLPFLLLEETFEALTIAECERVFDFIESRGSLLLEPKMFQRSKLVLLRMCNEVLRRLSKASNTEFCGRVLVFLASAFPLSERSAVNVKSLYNTGNTTEFDEMEVDEEAARKPETDVKQCIESADGTGLPVDANFYNTFWSLQQFFADPTTLYQVEAWTQFTVSTAAVMDALESHWLGTAGTASAAFVVDDFYFPKFLTSSRLMTLQLKDAYFVRHVLVQYLVLIQCLRSVKARTPIQELKEPQKKTLTRYEERCHLLLEKMTVDGKQFTEAVTSILDRESNWISWKTKGCKPYEKEIPAEPFQGLKRKREREAAESQKMGSMGEAALSKLWEQEAGQLESLKGASRRFQPDLQKQILQVMEEVDPVNEIEEEYRKTKKKVFAWRCIRLVAAEKLKIIKHASGQGKQADKTECNPDGIAAYLLDDYKAKGLYEN